MEKALRIYGEILRLVRRLPKDTRPYYAKYARENFVNYREVDANDSKALDELFQRAYNHSIWVLNKVLFPPFLSSYICFAILIFSSWFVDPIGVFLPLQYSVDQSAADKLKEVCYN